MSRDFAHRSQKKLIVILDTGALIAKYYRLLPRPLVEVYTSVGAAMEVIDRESREALEEAINLGLITLATPSTSSIKSVEEASRQIGCLHKLSRVDIEIAALALQLSRSGAKVVVITDDYELQNLLLYMGIDFKPLRTAGIRELRVFEAFCPVCGYTPAKPSEEICPFCGSKIVRKVVEKA